MDEQGEKLFVEVSRNTFYFNLSITYLFLSILPVFLFYQIRNLIIQRKNK
jgi:hypothetical protein